MAREHGGRERAKGVAGMRFSFLVFGLLLVSSCSQEARSGTLVWSDEFNGSSLSSTWTNGKFWWGGDSYNNPAHVYRTDATAVADGALSLTLRKENATNWQGKSVDYVSGLVQTGGIKGSGAPGFTFRYGYAEARIQMPKGQGVWPAFWMLPASYNDDAGEIDIMEYIGSVPNEINNFVHTNGKAEGGAWKAPTDMSGDWHTFAVDWQPTYITYYVDGTLTRTITTASMIPQEPEYLILNLQTGGSWAGFPVATTTLHATMKIDYVRVYSAAPGVNPEPTTAALILPLLGAMGLSLRRAPRRS
jgi:beta-glucanase (GH16 family)